MLGADFDDDLPAGALVWTSLLLCGAALYPAVRRNSAICGMVAAIAAGVAMLAAANWIFGAESQTVYRWLLLVLALAYVLASLVLRGGNPRHAELMVITGGPRDARDRAASPRSARCSARSSAFGSASDEASCPASGSSSCSAPAAG